MANQNSTKAAKKGLEHPSKQKFARIIIEWLHLALNRLGMKTGYLPQPHKRTTQGSVSAQSILKLLIHERASSIAPLDSLLHDIRSNITKTPLSR